MQNCNFLAVMDGKKQEIPLFTAFSDGGVILHRESYTEEQAKYMRKSFKSYSKILRDRLEKELTKKTTLHQGRIKLQERVKKLQTK